jgi:hypothetical protein
MRVFRHPADYYDPLSARSSQLILIRCDDGGSAGEVSLAHARIRKGTWRAGVWGGGIAVPREVFREVVSEFSDSVRLTVQ